MHTEAISLGWTESESTRRQRVLACAADVASATYAMLCYAMPGQDDWMERGGLNTEQAHLLTQANLRVKLDLKSFNFHLISEILA